jgi:putative cardiolipin synthase
MMTGLDGVDMLDRNDRLIPQKQPEHRHGYRLLAGCLLLAASACTSVPFDYPKMASHAQARDPNAPIARAALDWEAEHGDLSGFIGLPHGIDALGARLRMMEVAQHSIDAQYFILKKDRAGALFVGNMLLAADRGVRVRLLIDDVFTSGIDRELTLLNAHPDIEVRIFNPLSRNSLKHWAFLLDFRRVNRRMHNKSFTVDSAASIVGGRNIGEEYFELKQDVMFDDYELFIMGAAVRDISASFDQFWNSVLAVPVEAFGVEVDFQELDTWREQMRVRATESKTGIYSQAVKSSLLRDIRDQRIRPVPAPATVVSDSPDKLLYDVGDTDATRLLLEKRDRFLAADREIIIFTPYYIPREGGVEFLRKLHQRGVRVVIVTNSLASTNHVAVHGHYAKYRKRLLEAGAELWEIRAVLDLDETGWGHTPERVTLHSKATFVDRDTVFVGSLNFDPRSVFINTEMGVFIESAEIGGPYTEKTLAILPQVAYRVTLDERGALLWTFDGGVEREVWRKEPQASLGRRLRAGLYRLLPIEDQL